MVRWVVPECLDAAHQAAIAATHHAVEAAKPKAQIIFASSSRCLASTPVVQSLSISKLLKLRYCIGRQHAPLAR
jgi:hypothetical protein